VVDGDLPGDEIEDEQKEHHERFLPIRVWLWLMAIFPATRSRRSRRSVICGFSGLCLIASGRSWPPPLRAEKPAET
jgi:hypothetical protein